MPDIPNRDELEALYARQLGRKLRSLFRKMMDYVGDPPNFANVPASFWDEIGEELQPFFTINGEQIYLDAAERMIAETAIGVDWTLVNQAATDWAAQYAGQLVKDITETRRRELANTISKFFSEGWNRRELEERLSRWYNPVRSEMIATTEVTRAAAEGELQIARELAKQGIEMVAVWQTNNDEIVRECPICWPRHNKKRGDGWSDPPPAHVLCRCWINHEFA